MGLIEWIYRKFGRKLQNRRSRKLDISAVQWRPLQRLWASYNSQQTTRLAQAMMRNKRAMTVKCTTLLK